MSDDQLALVEAVNEAAAAVANVERILLLAQLPQELRPWARVTGPEDADVFGLLPDLTAVRLRCDGPVAVAERYAEGELVAEGVLVAADGRWRWVDGE